MIKEGGGGAQGEGLQEDNSLSLNSPHVCWGRPPQERTGPSVGECIKAPTFILKTQWGKKGGKQGEGTRQGMWDT